MIYATKQYADRECRINMRSCPSGGLWVSKRIVHIFGENTGSPYEDEAWQPQRVCTPEQQARRTMFYFT